MIKLLKLAIEHERDFIRSCRECEQRANPQVIAERLKAEGRLDALDCCLRAAKGDMSLLRILAGK